MKASDDTTGSGATFLFVPGDRPERFDKAVAARPDRVIIDLEDAVAQDRKALARAALLGWAQEGRNVVVRVNAAETPEFADDLVACRCAGVTVIMLPKAEDPRSIADVHATTGKPVIALIKSARGVRDVDKVAMTPGVRRLAFGSLDLALDLRMSAPDAALDVFRTQLVVASRVAGLAPPIDGVLADLHDLDRLAADVTRVKGLGFTAKLCVHPVQIETVRRGFLPTAAERAWAERIMAVEDGVSVVDGAMIDRPVRERAARILAHYRE